MADFGPCWRPRRGCCACCRCCRPAATGPAPNSPSGSTSPRAPSAATSTGCASLGYPVHATPGAAGYRLGAGADLPPLLLDDDEAVAVAVGPAHGRRRHRGRHRGDLPARARQAGAGTAVPAAPPGQRAAVGHRADGRRRSHRRPALTAIAAACRDRERLRFDYRAHDGTAQRPRDRAAPAGAPGRAGTCWPGTSTAQDWRTFRVDRIGPRTPTGPRFTPRAPPDPDLAAICPGRSPRGLPLPGPVHPARRAEVAAERIAPTIGALEPIDEHSCILRAGSNSLDELVIYVTTKGFDFHVHEPPELVEHVRTLTARLAGATD